MWSSIEIIKFDLIVNYQYEEIRLEYSLSSSFITPSFKLVIGDPSSYATDQSFYFNNLKVYLGGFYYIDYDMNDLCFLYINRVDMICAIPKKGYAEKNGQLVPED